MTNAADTQYLDLCRHILAKGTRKDDRTGTGTLSTFGHQMRFDLAEGFPLLTTKRVPFRLVAEELLWFLRGETDIKSLLDRNVNIWNGDAYRDYKDVSFPSEMQLDYDEFIEVVKDGGWDLGPIYGAQWRSWSSYGGYNTIDQIAGVTESIRSAPDSRRHIVSAWNVGDLDEMALPPCHTMFQFYVADGKLSCQLYQRSADVFLGLPFNIASYALLTHMIADITGLGVGEFVHTLGDAHIYANHVDAVQTQLERTPRLLPELTIVRSVEDPAEYTLDDLWVNGYDPHPTIKAPLSVG